MLLLANTIWFIFLFFWTLFLYQQPSHSNIQHYLYNLGYAAFMVPTTLLLVTKIIKGQKNILVHIFLALSSLCFFSANTAWFYFNLYFENAIPYPSIADLLWLAFYLFSLISATLIFVSQKPKIENLFEIIFITIIVFFPLHSFMTQNLLPSFSVFIDVLNFLYPLLDAFLVAIFLTILRNNPVAQSVSLPFLFSFLFFTIADALFAYQTSAQNYWNGNVTDLIFALASLLFCLGCIRFSRSETLAS